MGVKFKVFPEVHRVKVCVEDTCGELDIVLFLARVHYIREQYYRYLIEEYYRYTKRMPRHVEERIEEEEDISEEEGEEEGRGLLGWFGL